MRPAGWLATLLLGLSGSAQAQSFDFELTRAELAGTSSFVDDFSDGERDLPPTSDFFDLYGTTSEDPGVLRLKTGDGAQAFEYTASSLIEYATGYRDVVLLSPGPSMHGFFDGGGDGVFRTSWTGPLPEVTGRDYDRQLFTYLLVQGSGTAALNLSVIASDYAGDLAAATCQDVGPRVSMVYTEAFATWFACDPFDPAEVTGPIVLEVDFADASNSLSFAYSLDGGLSFRPSSAWQSPTDAVHMTAIQGGYALVGAGASATVRPSQLPGPGIGVAAGLLACGAAGLARRRHRA
jgi:hypothetical protein